MSRTNANARERKPGKSGNEEIIRLLGGQMSGSELNSLLLEVFRERTGALTPGDLLTNYRNNRFVQPSALDAIRLKQLELDMLRIALRRGYSPVQLSPVAPLGSCSAIGPVDQNKVVSATRGTEAVSDATNLLALHICDLIKSRKMSNRGDYIRMCTTHRHVRAQFFGDAPGMFPHFHILCIVTSGIDTGSYQFEKNALGEHLRVYRELFESLFRSGIEIGLSGRGGYTDREGLLSRAADHLERLSFDVFPMEPKPDNRYYKGLQFSIMTSVNGESCNIGDGGFVDWSQQLLGNRKERMLISAIGLDRLLL